MMANRHIVIINTSSEFLDALSAVLTFEEYVVTTYLLEQLLTQFLLPPPPDLLIVDFHPRLEDQCGTVYKRLRQQEMTAHIPVIIATTTPIAFESRFPTRDAKTHILSKPFLTGALLRLIGQLLEHLDDVG
jgi:CheY-like chemotaxis protein